jgi:NH3-dependent NAD+ synthetase
MTIPYMAIGEMLYNRWEEGRAAEILNFGLWQVQEMYDFYNNKSSEKPSKGQYKAGKGRFLNI